MVFHTSSGMDLAAPSLYQSRNGAVTVTMDRPSSPPGTDPMSGSSRYIFVYSCSKVLFILTAATASPAATCYSHC